MTKAWRRRLARAVAWTVGGFALALVALIAFSADDLRRIFVGLKIYEHVPPRLPPNFARPAILVFSKTNGFRHQEAIAAANTLFIQLAHKHGWNYVVTENAAIFSSRLLSKFDAVVFNNVSGDVFLPEQRAALRAYLRMGGGFVGIHGSGGDTDYAWRWYATDLIGAQFIGHPLLPHLQSATVRIEDLTHPATRTLPRNWVRIDEWYSFADSPRKRGYHILMSVDERSYRPGLFNGLSMGADHPIAWWHCEGNGRIYYTAMGHSEASYSDPDFSAMIDGALLWATRKAGTGCTIRGR